MSRNNTQSASSIRWSTPFESRRSGGEFGRDLAWFAVGAAVMYYLDPNYGRRRRSVTRDRFLSTIRRTARTFWKWSEYTGNRAAGLVAETRAAFTHDDVDDYTLCQRVRSEIGRAVSHPRSIQVATRDGRVTLAGPILAGEVDPLLRAASRVRGVKGVESRLAPYESAGDLPALQGRAVRPSRRAAATRENWDPATRAIAMTGGLALGLWGVWRRGVAGMIAAGSGALLVTRGLTNLPAKRLTGIGAGRRAVVVQKTITIDAPRDEVFSFFADYENFPRFMSNVREVRARDACCSHWVVCGPMGVELSWDADLTQYRPGELIAWRSVKGSTVENAGVIRFQDEARGTRVDIKLSYNPPAGAIGHVVARLFGADPKSEMDADLLRVKTTLETGHPAHDAARPLSRGIHSASAS